MKKILLVFISLLVLGAVSAQKEVTVRKKDRKKDILVQTSMGDMVFRLYDSTPLHRDNFLLMVKKHYYDSLLFHRVINNFMIQAGDPDSKNAASGKPLGEGSPGYNVPAEFRTSIFHKKGTLAAAREGDDVNPKRESSGSQFYIVKGKVFTPAGLDSVETMRLHRKLSPAQREAYTTVGGTPHLDGNYTAFGEMVKGFDVLDLIAATPTSKGADRDRPLQDVVILKTKLVRRKK
ncbi:MAG: peptidylprolyl isomerase [Chitinophagaceae bacterium]|nr:MAG: peptidylprolyl isomerase [Chitinophagaceae bacterium]